MIQINFEIFFFSKISSTKSNNLNPTDINLFTHELHVDGIGSSTLKILTAWRNNSLTRNVNLFPPKLDRGLNGHRIVVAAYEQPPFVMRRFL